MPDASKKESQDKQTASDAKPAAKQAGAQGTQGAQQNVQMAIQLAPVENSDQPVVANYTALNVSPGMVFIDFGFLEPAMLAALSQLAKQGGKPPERLNGKLAVRVAMGYDGLAGLHQQLGRVLAGLRDAAAAGGKKAE